MTRRNQDRNTQHPLVAVELGGHSVRAMAAEMTTDGLRILGVESSNRNICVERGVVTSTSNASYGISECLKLLANRIHQEALNKVFVPLGGRSMQILIATNKRVQDFAQPVPQSLLDEMEAECKSRLENRNQHAAILGLVPAYYKLDGKKQDDKPQPHQSAMLVETFYTAFVGRKELSEKVEGSFIRVPKHVEQTYVRADALLTALASDEDLEKGCAILDMGAQTTTLSIFKGNQYMYTKVASQGGYDISRDIEQLGITLPYAERLKCQYGCASPAYVGQEQTYRVPNATKTDMVAIRASELAEVIAARLDQTLDGLMLDLNRYANQIGVLYITGGASMLSGMEEYIQSKTTVPVMYGSHAPWLSADTPDAFCAPCYTSLVGTLLLGDQYRQQHPNEPHEDALIRRLKQFKKKVEEGTLQIFLPEIDDNY